MQENFLLKFQVFLFFSTINNIFLEKLECERVAEKNTWTQNSSVLTFASFSIYYLGGQNVWERVQ